MIVKNVNVLSQFWLWKLLFVPALGTIVNFLARILPGFGSSGVASHNAGTTNSSNNPLQGVTAAVGTTTFVIAGATALGPVGAISAGYIRVSQATVVVAGGTVTAIKITATDGTTTKVIYQDALARSADNLCDLTIPFNLDINANSFSIAITTGTQNSTFDIEVVGN